MNINKKLMSLSLASALLAAPATQGKPPLIPGAITISALAMTRYCLGKYRAMKEAEGTEGYEEARNSFLAWRAALVLAYGGTIASWYLHLKEKPTDTPAVPASGQQLTATATVAATVAGPTAPPQESLSNAVAQPKKGTHPLTPEAVQQAGGQTLAPAAPASVQTTGQATQAFLPEAARAQFQAQYDARKSLVAGFGIDEERIKRSSGYPCPDPKSFQKGEIAKRGGYTNVQYWEAREILKKLDSLPTVSTPAEGMVDIHGNLENLGRLCTIGVVDIPAEGLQDYDRHGEPFAIFSDALPQKVWIARQRSNDGKNKYFLVAENHPQLAHCSSKGLCFALHSDSSRGEVGSPMDFHVHPYDEQLWIMMDFLKLSKIKPAQQAK